MRLFLFLQKIIGFDMWHLQEIDNRPYAIETVNRINDLLLEDVDEGSIVEVGCGAGDVLSKIRHSIKKGYDIDPKVIKFARFKHINIPFIVGGFEDIKNEKVQFLIALNFLHTVTDDVVESYFDSVIKNNEILWIVVDEVQSPPYAYRHEYRDIIGKRGYQLFYVSRGYAAAENSRRKVLFFKKDDVKKLDVL